MFRRRALAFSCLVIALAAPISAPLAAAIEEIDAASKAVKAAQEAARRAAEAVSANSGGNSPAQSLPPATNAELERLERALKRGEDINSSLRSEVAALERERAQLVQVQAVLTSGLVGALVTAVVAVAGAVVTSRNSRPERDLKRLAVLEKIRELQGAGVQVPSDIEDKYARHQPEA